MTSDAAGGKTVLPSDLKIRAASGSVLIAIAVAELYLGGSYFVVFIGLLACGMIWEALNLTGVRGRLRRLTATALTGAAFLALMPALPNGGFPVWISLCLMGGTLIFAWSAATRKRAFPFGMVAAASVCIGCLVIVLAELRSEFYTIPPLILLVPAVIGTDIGAYFVGRALGGPKLAPKVSPNKTWSGAIGGVAIAVAAGTATVWAFRQNGLQAPLIDTLVMLTILSVCSQIGDLVESWLKRRAGQKDSGRLIPGHGGLLDRFDGFMGAAVLGLGPWLLLHETGAIGG
ncbi:MAG: phosphatidate cytidylyltransferase [Alphaproteobacteria bacterium]|nr:phosphatidate cytidylyltransferase [Alphaproteobacteria bacterium]